MEQKVRRSHTLRGDVIVPGDKSISHRAVLLNGIAMGRACIGNPSPSADLLSTISCLRELGVEIRCQGNSITVLGMGGFSEPRDVLNAGNSGTTMRLLAGLLSTHPFFSVITGDSSLRSRPMDRLIQPLRLMGAGIWGRENDSRAPLVIKGGQLHGIRYRLPVASAQVKSAILLAGLRAKGKTTVAEQVPSRDHTERLLKVMGVDIEIQGHEVTISPLAEPLPASDVRVPGDISSAAFWLVAAAIHPRAKLRLRNVGVNPTRSGILDVLKSMGAELRVEDEWLEGGEPVADISIESSSLVATQIAGGLVPRVIDEIPVLAVAASVAEGTTVIRDAQELRVKEADRIATIVRELSRLGAEIEELPDGMVIHGVRGLRGTGCDSYGDHRLAMALGVAGLVAEGETVICDAEAVSFSYPQFWHELGRLAG
jgi:3-phosphoshikimate 1-carboxyvinyltransferase